MSRHAKRRIPKLRFTKTRGIGWHVNYRDPQTDVPRRRRFGMIDRDAASEQYRQWLAEHLRGAPHRSASAASPAPVEEPADSDAKAEVGSLLHVASNYLYSEERRVHKPGEPRRAGTITAQVLADRRHDVKEFLKFINERHGAGSVGQLSVLDLKMQDVEEYNRQLVDAGYSDVLVSNRMLAVKAITERAGRPEFGEQVLTWNWNARDKLRGKPRTPRTLRTLPSLAQLKAILKECDKRSRAIVWMAIGLGFGQGDLSAIRVGQIDAKGYDLRRGKTRGGTVSMTMLHVNASSASPGMRFLFSAKPSVSRNSGRRLRNYTRPTPVPTCWSWTSWATPSTNTGPTCSSRSSANATNAAPSS